MRKVVRSSSARLPTESWSNKQLKCYLRECRSYPTHSESRLIRELAECLVNIPSLRPVVDNFTSAEGTVQRLVALRGTVPISYKGATYKIPVHIWLMPYHPNGPPLIFVVPTCDMSFRRRHPHVDCTNGLVYLPYLSTWDALNSTISGSVHAMIEAFAQKPPVYSKPRLSNSFEDEDERRRLISSLSQRLTIALNENSNNAVDTVAAFITRKEERKEQLDRDRVMKARIEEKSELSTVLRHLYSSKLKLETWLEQHWYRNPETSVDIATHPKHIRQQQKVECRAEDAAFSDALDCLDEAISRRAINDETYIHDVRYVARKQFLARALLRKIACREASSQSTPSASNASDDTHT